jgi:hypothetical protein
MPSWLVLSWALTVGYVPAQYEILTSPLNTDTVENLRSGLIATSAELGVNAEILKHFRLSASCETYQYLMPELFGFAPYRADYVFGAAIFADNIELGLRHECDHGVNSGPIEGHYASLETQFYLKISGTTK